MPEAVLQRFADKGGIKYTRTYYSTATLEAMKQQQQQQQDQKQQQQPQKQQQQPPRRGPPPMSWQEKTGCSDKEAAAAYFTKLGFTVEFRDTPEGPDTLVAWHVVPAVIRHPVTLQQLWFNIAHLPFPGTTYADGEPIEKGTGRIVCVCVCVCGGVVIGCGQNVCVCVCAHGACLCVCMTQPIYCRGRSERCWGRPAIYCD